jgi:L-alanine-DL-glutamate epimerase-like enolase superfamily enzyme
MIIAKIETFPLRIPFKADTQSAASAWGDKNLPVADSLLAKVTTDDGLEGWGEAFSFRAVRSAQLAVDELIGPLCVGHDATQIASLMLDVQKKLHIFGRTGPLFYGISAVDIALWDIAGKAVGVSISRLLGGGVSELHCYASLIRCSDPALVRANVRRALERGFRSLKLHEVEDIASIRAAREEAGPDVELTLDVNCAWTLHEAQSIAQELKAFHLKLLEEPIWPPENYAGLAESRRTSGIPIAAGVNVSTLLEFDRLMGAGAVDFVQPSVAKMGGISELCKVFPVATARHATLMPHVFYDGPGLLAAIHVTAALGTADAMIEWRDFDLEAEFYSGILSPKDGRIQVPQNPGLGIDPDPDVIRTCLRA